MITVAWLTDWRCYQIDTTSDRLATQPCLNWRIISQTLYKQWEISAWVWHSSMLKRVHFLVQFPPIRLTMFMFFINSSNKSIHIHLCYTSIVVVGNFIDSGYVHPIFTPTRLSILKYYFHFGKSIIMGLLGGRQGPTRELGDWSNKLGH